VSLGVLGVSLGVRSVPGVSLGILDVQGSLGVSLGVRSVPGVSLGILDVQGSLGVSLGVLGVLVAWWPDLVGVADPCKCRPVSYRRTTMARCVLPASLISTR